MMISLTSVAARADKCDKTLRSLARQGVRVNAFLPLDPPRAFVKRKIEVTRCEDYGPITKLIPALDTGNGVIITADDDRKYGDGWAQGLIDGMRRNPNCVICYRGKSFSDKLLYRKLRRVEKVRRDTRVDIPLGYAGVLYHSDFFDRDWIEEMKRVKPRNDDLYIAKYLRDRGVPIIAVPQLCSIRETVCAQIGGLHHENVRGRRNDIYLRELFGGGE